MVVILINERICCEDAWFPCHVDFQSEALQAYVAVPRRADGVSSSHQGRIGGGEKNGHTSMVRYPSLRNLVESFGNDEISMMTVIMVAANISPYSRERSRKTVGDNLGFWGSNGWRWGKAYYSILVEYIGMMWVSTKNRGGPPKSWMLIGVSIIFTIHFGVPLFLETPMYTV